MFNQIKFFNILYLLLHIYKIWGIIKKVTIVHWNNRLFHCVIAGKTTTNVKGKVTADKLFAGIGKSTFVDENGATVTVDGAGAAAAAGELVDIIPF